jgi:hypothetical protein
VAIAAFVLVKPGAWAAPSDASPANAETEALFALETVPGIQIEIPPAEIERLRGGGWSWARRGAAKERPEVQATIREGGRVYTNVALHLKGAAGSFQPIDKKPSFTLNFDKYVKSQTFHGLEKISLNNSVQDPSYSSERLCRELFNEAGVPAPRAGYATVELNGRLLGLYVLLEGYNRQFLKRHFKNSKGNLYDGGFLRDIDSRLATNSGDASDQSSLIALAEAAEDPDRATRFAALEQVLDMDQFITFLAMEILVCHWDGYGINKNNYRVYFNPEIQRTVFMPHGMDQMFGVMMVQPSMGVRPPFQGLVARALLETSEGRRRYFKRLAELNQSLFDVEAITNRVCQTAAKVQPILAQSNPSAAAAHLREVEDLCDRIAQRKLSLDDQLSGAQGTVLEFNSAGIALLGRWNSVTNFGAAVVAESVNSGRPVLSISAPGGVSVGSWRTKVLLEEGRYRFEGRMHIKDVAGDPRDGRAGAGLRVYGRPASQKVLGSADWKDVACEFEVPEGMRDVELICELRAHQGEVWFDRDSLRLVRE